MAHLSAHISSAGGQRLAICGIGGTGKTALVLESAYRTHEQQPSLSVFWVPAVSRESFLQAYREICVALCIEGITDDKADVKRLKTRLSDDNFRHWLMIVDNADDDTVLFGTLGDERTGDRLIDFIPQSRKGSVIFTTRTRDVAVKLADNSIPLGELEKLEGKEVLMKRILSKHYLENDTIVDEFLSMLNYLPLAIVQAVAFINKNDISLSEYMSCYRVSEKDAAYLLSRDFEDQRRYRGSKNPVSTTWYISFQQIHEGSKLAAEYLSFMACTANNDIPASLLPQNGSRLEQINAIGTLKAYAFVTEREPPQYGQAEQLEQSSEKSFDVHPLVHLAIREWLKEHDQWEMSMEITLDHLLELLPTGYIDAMGAWISYLPHAMHVAEHTEVFETIDGASLFTAIGSCEYRLGRYKDAENSHKKALKLRETKLGKEHPSTLESMNDLALAIYEQGKYVEAETMLQETLALDEKILGKEDRRTLAAQGNLALTLQDQGKYAEAETLYRKTLVLHEKVLGKESRFTLNVINNLANILTEQGRFSDAEELHQAALVRREKVLGKEHPDTPKSMNNLAQTFYLQGKLAQAQELSQKALVLRQKVLGKEHPDTMYSMNILADILGNQGKYAQAEVLKREVLALREKVLGKTHRLTLHSLWGLADLFAQQNRNEEALVLYEEAYTGFLDVLGPNHPETLDCLEGYTYLQQLVDESAANSQTDNFSDAVSEATPSDAQVSTPGQVESTMESQGQPPSNKRPVMISLISYSSKYWSKARSGLKSKIARKSTTTPGQTTHEIMENSSTRL